jgi:hypothetical protein
MAAKSRESCRQIILCPGFLAAFAALLEWNFLLQALPSTEQQNLVSDLFCFISTVISAAGIERRKIKTSKRNWKVPFINNHLFDFKLLPWRKLNLLSSGLLRSTY